MSRPGTQLSNKKIVVAGISLAILFGTTSCETNNKTIGAVLGAAGGGLVGSQIGDGSGRIIAIVVGAAAGAWIGAELAGALEEEDQEELAEATQTTAVTGETQSWSTPETGVTGSTRVVETSRQKQSIAVPVKKARVQAMPAFDYVGSQFVASANSNVRGGPGTEYVIVDSINEGETVDVIGKVAGEPWYIIGEDGVATGFVYAELLQDTGRSANITVADAGAGDSTVEAEVNRQCRSIEQIVVLKDGSERKEQVEACQGPNGWEVV